MINTVEICTMISSDVFLPVDSKEQGESSDCLLTPRQVVHGAEPLARCDTVVVDAVQIRFLSVLRP